MTRTRRSTWNYLASLAYLFTAPVLSLVSIPLLLRWLGAERLGAYRAASDWGGYVGLLELGLGGALLPIFARTLGQGDKQATYAALVAGFRAYLRVMTLMGVAAAVLVIAIPWLVPVEKSLVAELRLGYVISTLALPLAPFATFRSFAEAAQRSYLVHGLSLFQVLLTTSLALVFARKNWGIAGQFAAVTLGMVPFYVVLSWDASRRCPGLARHLVADCVDPILAKELRSLSGPTLATNLCGRLGLMTDNIIIAAVLDPASVVPFFLTQRAAQLAQAVLQALGTASWAAMAELHAKQEFDTFNRRICELTCLTAVLSLASLVPITAYNRHFIALWTGAERYGGDLVSVLAAMNAMLLAQISLWNWIFAGTGQVRRTMPILLTSTALNVVVSIVATIMVGLPGPLIGTTTALGGLMLWAIPLQLRATFGTSLSELFRAVAAPTALGIPYAILVAWIARSHQPSGWLGLAGEMSVAGGVFLLLAWCVVFDREERLVWRSRLLHAVGVFPAPAKAVPQL